MNKLSYRMNETLLQAMLYDSPTKSEKIINRYSRLWWDNVAYKCDKCKYFDGHDMCHYKKCYKSEGISNDLLLECDKYTAEEINKNLQKIEDIIIEEFPEFFNNEFGYHTIKIEKGELGEFSKIREEFEELEDAIKQNDSIMAICECSDIIGAIEAFTISKYNITLDDLISFNKKTQNAFKIGKR